MGENFLDLSFRAFHTVFHSSKEEIFILPRETRKVSR